MSQIAGVIVVCGAIITIALGITAITVAWCADGLDRIARALEAKQ